MSASVTATVTDELIRDMMRAIDTGEYPSVISKVVIIDNEGNTIVPEIEKDSFVEDNNVGVKIKCHKYSNKRIRLNRFEVYMKDNNNNEKLVLYADTDIEVKPAYDYEFVITIAITTDSRLFATFFIYFGIVAEDIGPIDLHPVYVVVIDTQSGEDYDWNGIKDFSILCSDSNYSPPCTMSFRVYTDDAYEYNIDYIFLLNKDDIVVGGIILGEHKYSDEVVDVFVSVNIDGG